MIRIAVLAAVVLTAGMESAYGAGFAQAPGSPVPVAGGTGAVALGDLNGDGKVDAAVADPVGAKVSVLLGTGRGGLAAATGSPIATGGTKPSAIAIGDLNGDGKPDLVVANDGSKSVSVLLGDGAGGFAAATKSPYATGGTRPASVALGDFNGDTKLDVVVVHFSSGDVSVMTGDGSGALARATGSPVATGGSHPGPSALGDFNGDGKLDLAVANESGNVSVMTGNGSGKLARGGASPFGLTPGAIGAGDFNGDGKLDVAVANKTGTLSILVGNGTGGLVALPAPQPVIALGTGPASLGVADLDRDGRLDVAVANAGSGNVSVLLGDGSGKFAAAPLTPVQTGGLSPSALSIDDLNGDAKPDLAVVNATSASLSVLLNGVVPPSAAFVSYPLAPVIGEQVTFAYSSPGAIEALDWDLNGDGLFDDAHGATAGQVFFGAGSYPISLRVTDVDGVVATTTRQIVVGLRPAIVASAAVGAAQTYVGLMAPFPVVRVTGRTARRGARIKQLAVIAPAGAKVTVRCSGKGCPFKAWRRTVGSKALTLDRLRGRLLRGGTTLEVRVTGSRVIGKYVKLVMRKRRPPARSDLCLAPGSSAATQCPSS